MESAFLDWLDMLVKKNNNQILSLKQFVVWFGSEKVKIIIETLSLSIAIYFVMIHPCMKQD